MWGSVDWVQLFSFSMPVVEIMVRGAVVYLSLLCMLRLLQREAGALSMSDLLLVVLIADAAQNAMAGEYKTIADGLLLVGTIIFLSYALDWLAYRFAFIRRFVHPAPVPLIRDGQLMHRNMRRELVSKEELMSQLREQGVDTIAKVRHACLEGDGKISVIEYEENDRNHAPEPNIH